MSHWSIHAVTVVTCMLQVNMLTEVAADVLTHIYCFAF